METTDAAPEQLVFGNLHMNLANFAVWVAEKPVELTFFEFELLLLLCREADRNGGG